MTSIYNDQPNRFGFESRVLRLIFPKAESKTITYPLEINKYVAYLANFAYCGPHLFTAFKDESLNELLQTSDTISTAINPFIRQQDEWFIS